MARTETRGIVAIDPSFRGLGVMVCTYTSNGYTIYSDDTDILELSGLNMRKTLSASKLIDCVSKWVKYIIKKIPKIMICDTIIMENQFHINMKDLSKTICNQLVHVLNVSGIHKTKCIFLSALTVKRNLGVDYCNDHHKNKLLALKYIKDNSNVLIGSNLVISHNEADACLLLNTYKRVRKYICFWMSDSETFTCPGCKGKAFNYTINKEDSKYKGSKFMACKSTSDGNGGWTACEKKYQFVLQNKKDAYNAFLLYPDIGPLGVKRSPETAGICISDDECSKLIKGNPRDNDIYKLLNEIKDICGKTLEIIGCYTELKNDIVVSNYNEVSN
jgi:hypothetical protein